MTQNKISIPKINVENKFLKKDFLGLAQSGESSDEKNAYIALKYYDKDFECFSDWKKDELKLLSKHIELINKQTWNQLKRNPGIQYKDITNTNKLPSMKNKLSDDITFCEMRISQKARIIGFRDNAIFFLCWLDRNHRICS